MFLLLLLLLLLLFFFLLLYLLCTVWPPHICLPALPGTLITWMTRRWLVSPGPSKGWRLRKILSSFCLVGFPLTATIWRLRCPESSIQVWVAPHSSHAYIFPKPYFILLVYGGIERCFYHCHPVCVRDLLVQSVSWSYCVGTAHKCFIGARDYSSIFGPARQFLVLVVEHHGRFDNYTVYS